MIKKILMALLVLISVCGMLQAKEAENLSLTVSQMKIVNVGFPFQLIDVRITDREVLKAEKSKERSDQLCVTCLSVGKAEIYISNAMGNCHYIVNVDDDSLNAIYRSLRKALEPVGEVELSLDRDLKKVCISGEVFNLDNWNMLRKRILPNFKNYGEYIQDYTIFRPTPEVLLRLQEKLKKAGYKVEKDENSEQLEPGEIILKSTTDDTLIVSGEVYCDSEKQELLDLMATEPWLALDEKNATAPVKFVDRIKVRPTLLKVNVAFVGLTETEGSTMGTNLLSKGISINGQYGFSTTMQGDHNNSFSLSASLPTVLNLLAESGCSRFHHGGYINLMSNESNTYKSFHVGGTIKVRINSDGGTGSLQDINYGINIKAKGGLLGQKRVKLDMQVSVTAPAMLNNGDYDTQGADTETIINCNLGETVALAGLQSLTDGVSRSGLPVLRNTPVLQWFFSSKEKSKEKVRLLILVYPEVAGVTQPMGEIPKLTPREFQSVIEQDAEEIKKQEDKKKPWWRRIF